MDYSLDFGAGFETAKGIPLHVRLRLPQQVPDRLLIICHEVVAGRVFEQLASVVEAVRPIFLRLDPVDPEL
jgi:hypothetical protein